MDKTVSYDEPLDPHWERLNASGPTLEQMLSSLEPTSVNNQARHHLRENIVPFATRQTRAREMRENLDHAILDGHLERFPSLEKIARAFADFAAAAEELGFQQTKQGGKNKHRDEWLELYRLAWVNLRKLESDGFPLMDYVESPALDRPEKIVGTLRIEKLPDGTILRVTHVPVPNGPGVS